MLRADFICLFVYMFTLTHIKGKEGIDLIQQAVKQFTKAAISSSPVSFSFPISKVLNISLCLTVRETQTRNAMKLLLGRQVEE